MQSKARVIVMGKSTGMVVVETCRASISVLELLGVGIVKSGEILSGNLNATGLQEIYSETRDESLRVFIHEHDCDLNEAIEYYFAPRSSDAPPRRPTWPVKHPEIAVGVIP